MARTREEYNEYMRVYMAERYARRWAAAVAQLGGKCVRCDAIEGLDFDHVDPATKLFEIGTRLAGISEAKLQAELAKCQLLCRPHHIEKTRENGEGGGGQNRIIDPDHGTWARYRNFKCRCPECRRWYKLYRLRLVDARGNPRTSITAEQIEAIPPPRPARQPAGVAG